MIQRKTQTAEYWQSFTLTSDDIDFLHALLMQADGPLTTQALADALVAERCRREESELRAELARGVLYQPRKSFSVGDEVIFPALDFRLGRVVDIRPGKNPEYGQFDVITVDFGPDRRQRSFAANLAAPHKLNAEIPDLLGSSSLASPQSLLATVAGDLPQILAEQLAAQPEFARFEDHWLLRDVLADIHIGHLNIAEALIEVHGAPQDAWALLKELDLPAEISPEIALFSLQAALAADGRFDQVGPGESRQWYLRRLEPAEALEMPEPLRPALVPFNRDALTPELRHLEWELDDEWSEGMLTATSSIRATIPSATILLIYPHLISGTLPLNTRSRAVFPRGHGERVAVTLIDGRWGQRFQGWVVPAGRYVAGLRPWFEKHKLPAGAYIVLERRDDSGEVVVDFRPKRMRREWTRWAQVVEGDRLDIQLRKQEVACEYDELVIIGEDRPADLLRLRSMPHYANAPLSEVVHQMFADLAGLSQQGTVHAKTLYSAINLVRRCPPGPIFEVLATDRRYQSVGDGLYRLAI